MGSIVPLSDDIAVVGGAWPTQGRKEEVTFNRPDVITGVVFVKDGVFT
jgi:hypothetical protein